MLDIFNSANVSIATTTFANNRGTGISRQSLRANTGAVAIGYNNIPNYEQFPVILAEVMKCNFTNNRARAVHEVRSTSAVFSSKIFSGRGGGLGIFCSESIYNISVNLIDNHFENNYARSFGAALYLVTFGKWTQNVYSLNRNYFLHNSAPLGGGAISNTFFSNGIPSAPHKLLMTDCTFKANIGQSGGALSIYLPYGGIPLL